MRLYCIKFAVFYLRSPSLVCGVGCYLPGSHVLNLLMCYADIFAGIKSCGADEKLRYTRHQWMDDILSHK